MLWPKKPPTSKPLEQFVPPPMGYWEVACQCGEFYRVHDTAELLEELEIRECAACHWVNDLSASAQDHYLNALESE